LDGRRASLYLGGMTAARNRTFATLMPAPAGYAAVVVILGQPRGT
jgi:hypothetical protein